MLKRIALALLLFLPTLPLVVAPLDQIYNRVGYKQRGEASYYAEEFHGRKTASGEKYDMNALTAAHPRIRFHTLLRVTNLYNNKSVIVRVNDRGPYKGGRIIDLSKAAAMKIDMIRTGTAPVQLEVLHVETGPVTESQRRENEERIRRQEEQGTQQPSEPEEKPPISSEEERRNKLLERIRRLLGKPPEQKEENHRPQENKTPSSPETRPPEQPPPAPKPETPDKKTSPEEPFGGINTYRLDGQKVYPEGHGVQLGSYNKLESALQLGRAVEQTQLANVYIQTGWAGSLRIFRVIAGEGSLEQARQLANQLKAKGFNGFPKQHY
ncbi:MAG: septal ring lytic transglycosylase RlpA family protein [Cytophagales bacterium]|nr:septal ring lytic transglycosylase RlpA family protein [Bernardetiaceae bacterium]MDW8211586.1 septal ring lytic transglycosylase RlpA family protein [Cytophagales bacterium]